MELSLQHEHVHRGCDHLLQNESISVQQLTAPILIVLLVKPHLLIFSYHPDLQSKHLHSNYWYRFILLKVLNLVQYNHGMDINQAQHLYFHKYVVTNVATDIYCKMSWLHFDLVALTDDMKLIHMESHSIIEKTIMNCYDINNYMHHHHHTVNLCIRCLFKVLPRLCWVWGNEQIC